MPLRFEIRHRLLASCSLFKRKGPLLEHNGPFLSKSSTGKLRGYKCSNCSHTFCEHRSVAALR
jgi:hypothetical protein